MSSFLPAACGTPQGSVLEPTAYVVNLVNKLSGLTKAEEF